MGFDLGIGEVAAAASLAGTAASAVGSIASANASSKEAAYQAQVAKNNDIIAEQNANYATEAGAAKTYDAGLRTRAQQGALLAGLAANGVDVNSGSSEDVRQTERQTGEVTQERTAQDAALTAYGYRSQGTNFQAQSGLDTAESKAAPTAGYLKGIGGLLSSASTLPTKFSWMKGDDGEGADYGGVAGGNPDIA
jgi:hypothetical protein